MPTSECRRGNCLSCVATVVSGAPFSLRVSDSTALCRLAKEAQLVPLCSAFVTGPNLSMDLDGGPSKAWDLPGPLVESPAPPYAPPAAPREPACCLAAWLQRPGRRAHHGGPRRPGADSGLVAWLHPCALEM